MQTFTSLRRTARSLGLVTVSVLSTLGALSLAHVGPASAQTPGVNLAQLAAAVSTLQSKLATDEATITSQGNTITSLQSSLNSVQSKQTTDESNISTNATNVSKLQTLTAAFSLSSDPSAGGTNTLLTLTGVNVQIVNGQGSTSTTNGLGNLIIGYNEKDPQFTQNRTGSHNLVVGTQNNYLSYGGLIAGQDNLISATAPYASVSGGYQNTASSEDASVSGGIGNTASGDYASVSGGGGNAASGPYASVSGGEGNTASGQTSSISGGISNTASASFASVSGGAKNVASGTNAPGYSVASWVGGGNSNTAGAAYASVSGGSGVTQSHAYGWSGGSYHTP